MDGSAIVKRYADGFLAFAEGCIGREKAMEELHAFHELLKDHPEFRDFLNNPSMQYSEKSLAIKDVMAASFSVETIIFALLLLKKGRMSELDRIAEYVRVKYSHGERLEALLSASYPVDTEVLEKLKDGLEKRLGSKLHIYMDLDTDLLGGVKAQVGNTIIDGSIRKRFQDLKQKLMAARVDVYDTKT